MCSRGKSLKNNLVLPDYTSDGENDVEKIVKKKKSIRYKYILKNSLETTEEALQSIDSTVWAKWYKNSCTDGQKVYYRCKLSKFREKQCEKKLYLHYLSDSLKVNVYESVNEHTHLDNSEKNMSPDVKAKIVELFNLNIKPNSIPELLREQNMKVPKKSILLGFLRKSRKEKFGKTILSFEELEIWCKNNYFNQNDEDKPFVADYLINYGDDMDYDEIENQDEVDGKDDLSLPFFRLFITTKRLLELTLKTDKINIDTTHKLVWQGFPIFIVGTTDIAKHFHPFGISVCTNEHLNDFKFIFNGISKGLELINQAKFEPKVLISDGSMAIRNAFKEFYNCSQMVMCSCHMFRAVDKFIEAKVSNEIDQESIKRDIRILQISSSRDIFQKAIPLFKKKWKKYQDFVVYFQKEWVDTLDGWYEGYTDIKYCPSHNNALEATTKIIKDKNTLRERLALSQFLIVSCDIVKNWSLDRAPSAINRRIFYNEQPIDLQLYTKAYQWLKLNKTTIIYESKIPKCTDYFVPTFAELKIKEDDVLNYSNLAWNTFQRYSTINYKVWCITIPDDGSNGNWKNGSCNCPHFMKNYICKHLVGLAMRLKYIKVPAAAKDVPIGEKRKRGRPAKAFQALMGQ